MNSRASSFIANERLGARFGQDRRVWAVLTLLILACGLLISPSGMAAARASLGETAAPVMWDAAPVTVEMVETEPSVFAFQPANITVTRGTGISWFNTTGVNHSATSRTLVWNTGVLEPNHGFGPFYFRTTGTFPYYCAFHENMVGEVSVVDAVYLPLVARGSRAAGQ